MAVPETADAELPMLALAYGLSRPLGYVYGILLLLYLDTKCNHFSVLFLRRNFFLFCS